MSEQQQDPRPAPQYGEYAPEGWEWKPEGGSAADAPAAASPDAPVPTAQPGTGRVPGVPHNLGAGPGAAPQAAPAQHYRGTVPPQGAPTPATAPAAGGQPRSRTGDRVITIVLLALGAFGALWTAASLYQLPGSFALIGRALQLDGFAVPAAVTTIGLVGALVVFGLYALNLVYSLQRVRRGKLAFWVPLVTAVIAFIVAVSCSAFALNQMPELLNTLISDPDASARMLDYLSSQAQ